MIVKESINSQRSFQPTGGIYIGTSNRKAILSENCGLVCFRPALDIGGHCFTACCSTFSLRQLFRMHIQGRSIPNLETCQPLCGTIPIVRIDDRKAQPNGRQNQCRANQSGSIFHLHPLPPRYLFHFCICVDAGPSAAPQPQARQAIRPSTGSRNACRRFFTMLRFILLSPFILPVSPRCPNPPAQRHNRSAAASGFRAARRARPSKADTAGSLRCLRSKRPFAPRPQGRSAR